MKKFFLIAAMLVAAGAGAVKPYGALPTKDQVAWQQLEYYMFVHFGPNTFTNVEWGDGKEDPKVFAPASVDCRQWAQTAKAAGMKGIILTAKHHDGFCLWPSKYSTHTVRESGYRGDILRELSDACKAEGLLFGVYLSPWDQNHPAYGTPQYNQVFANTLNEVLTGYGPVFEQWFDGANGEGHGGKKQTYDWDLFHKVVYKDQPHAIIFSDVGPGCRWAGNEQGVAGATNWSTLNVRGYEPGRGAPPGVTLNEGVQGGEKWVPAEVDVSIRPGWFYSPSTDGKVKSTEQLMDIYYTSVGRNANLLLNVPPDRSGRIHKNDSLRLMEFRRAREAAFSDNLALGLGKFADGNYDTYKVVRKGVLTVDLGAGKRFNHIVLQEYIPLGQRVTAVRVFYERGGEWLPLVEATTVGYKRILRFETVAARRIRVEFNALAMPVISEVALYNAPEISTPGFVVSTEVGISKAGWTASRLGVVDDNPESAAAVRVGEPVIIDMSEVRTLKGFVYEPVLQTHAANVYRYDLETSVDAATWMSIRKNAMFANVANNPVRQEVLFDAPVEARYLRFTPREAVGEGSEALIVEAGAL